MLSFKVHDDSTTGCGVTAIILAGGKSSRMGRDKAFLEFRGKTFSEFLIGLVSPMVDEILLVVDDRNKFPSSTPNVKIVEDKIKGQGPLVGIWSGLLEIKNDSAFVLSCDMPLVRTAQLENLRDQDSADADVICFVDAEGRPQPFPAIYKKGCAGKMDFVIQRGQFAMKDFLKKAVVKTVSRAQGISTDFFNVNTKEDYEFLTVSS